MLGLLLSRFELHEPLLLVFLDVLHSDPHLLRDYDLDQEVGLSWVYGVILLGDLE